MENLTPEQQQAMWDEVAAERNGPTADTPPTPADAASFDTPEGQDDATAQAAADAAAAEPAPKADPIAEVIATLTAKIDKLEGRQRSVDGHIGSLTAQQKSLNEKMLGQLAAGRAAADKVDNAPSATQIAAAVKNPQEWEDLKDEYPTWANATEKFFEARLATFKNPSFDPEQLNALVTEKVKGVLPEVRREIVDATLDGVLPNWKQEINKPEFLTWMHAQPDDIKALSASESVGDAARMLRLFDQSRQSSPAVRLNEARKQTLANAVTPPRGKPVPKQKTPDQMSGEELWNYEAAQREKEKAQRGY